MVGRLLRRIAALVRSQALDRDTDEEMAFHLEMEAEQQAAAGRAPAESARMAQRAFGSPLLVREEVRDAHGLRWWDDLRADGRIVARSIRRNPAFHLVFIGTIALGVSLATVILTAADAILLRPVPYVDRERTVSVWSVDEPGRPAWPMMTVASWRAWRSVGGPFEALASYDLRGADYADGERASSIAAAAISPAFFRILAVPALRGRLFDSTDFANRNTVVISERFWRRQLRAAPDAIGRSILLDGRSTTVIGILPGDFGFPRRDNDLWLPQENDAPDRYAVQVIGRLRVPRDEADRTLGDLAAALRRDHPKEEVATPVLRPFGARRINLDISRGVAVLSVGSLAVLLIAALNGANLLLLRGLARRREFATRLALGAGRSRLMRQLLTEALLLSGLAAIAALAASALGVALLRESLPEGFTWQAYHEVTLSPRLVVGSLLASLVLGVGISLWPAIAAGRGRAGMYRAGQLGGGGVLAQSQRGKRWLVVAELAVSTALLIGSGLLVRSFANLAHVELGLDVDRLAILSFGLPRSRYPDPGATAGLVQRLEQGLAAIPGVSGWTMADGMAPSTAFGTPDSVVVEGREGEAASIGAINQISIDTGYFRVVGTPLLRGRTFNPQDGLAADHVAIIDTDLAQRLWSGADPLGKRFRLGSAEPWLTVVGIAGDARLGGPDERGRSFELYYPAEPGRVGRAVFLAVRAAGDPEQLLLPLQRLVTRVDPLLPLWSLEPMRVSFDEQLAKPRFLAGLVSWFGAIGLLLGIVGLYGVISFGVSQRTSEFGLRQALGASPSALVAVVLRQSALLAAIGIAVGLGVAALTGSLAAPLLYRESPVDVVVYLVVALVVAGGSIVAALVPARQAGRVAPVEALRHE